MTINENLQNIISKESESKLISAIYVVSTPIGNISDITIRAALTLQKSDYIICENINVSKKLCNIIGIQGPKFISYNDHSDQRDREKILGLIIAGNAVSLISDAGTPLISDPGYKLISYLQKNKIEIFSVPGASALTAAISISGQPSDSFFFQGFLPNTEQKKKNILENLKSLNSSLIFFESPKKLLKTLSSFLEVLGNRNISIVREVTKIHEEVIKGNLDEVINLITSREEKIRGEIVIIIAPAGSLESKLADQEILDQLEMSLKKMSLKDAVEFVAKNNGLKRNQVYKLALTIKS